MSNGQVYMVSVLDEEKPAPESRTTEDEEEALDWFTNAASEVFDTESPIIAASIRVDGQPWGMVTEGGLDPPAGGGEGEPVPIRRRTKAA